MINKENFIYYINKLKELRSAEDKLNSAGEIFDFSISFGEHEQLIISILEKVFQDDENYWLNYFIYEINFGSEWHEGCITTKDGVDVPMRDAGELYDVLVGGMDN